MNTAQTTFSDPRELGRLLIVHWRRVAVVTVAITGVAAAYALVMPKSWQATQAMIVRSEAIGNDSEAAKSRSPEELKCAEETIVELAKAPSVLRRALAEVGPPAGSSATSSWPGDADVERLQAAVKIVPPKGVELGTSEVFYLEVRDKSRERAIDLSKALCDRLQREMQEIRNTRAQSMIDELDKAVEVAKADLRAATARLNALDKEAGSDLPELRSLLDANSSDTSLRRTVTEIENELRQCRAAEEGNQQLLNLLDEAEADPSRLVAAPSRLLDSQPALRRLKDGLVDAQLRTAALEGRMSPDHPEVLSAREAEEQVASRLHDELATAVRGVRVELAYAVTRVQFLEHQRDQSAARLERMAGLRTTYSNALSESANRAKSLERADQSLTLARSTQASAKAASLIALVDRPETGANPVSPSRLAIVLGGLLGGLVTGIGLVLLTAPAQHSIEQCSAVAIRSSAGAVTGPASVTTTMIVPYCLSDTSVPLAAVTVTTLCD